MNLCSDVKDKLVPGMTALFLDYRGLPIGYHVIENIGDRSIILSCDGVCTPWSLNTLYVILPNCTHQWKRLDLFRTTEFHCIHCQAMRPFDIEKDEAA